MSTVFSLQPKASSPNENVPCGTPLAGACRHPTGSALVDLAHLLVPKGAVGVDVGTGDGRYTRECARLVGARGSVCAFESSPGKRAALHQSLQQQGVQNVTVFPYQLFHGGASSARNVSVAGRRGSACWTGAQAGPDVGTEAVLPVVRTLDTVLNRLRLHRLDVLKIDAGGHEPEALEGALETIQRFSPVVILACQPLAEMCPGAFYRWLQALGWVPYTQTFAPLRDTAAFAAYYNTADADRWLLITLGPLPTHPLARNFVQGAHPQPGVLAPPMLRRQASCPLCGQTLYGPGPGGRFTPGEPEIMPRCTGCQSLERHRGMRLIWNRLRPLLGNVSALQFSPDPSPPGGAFASLEVSVYGGENSLDLQQIAREDASYGMVLCNHVLEHVADDGAAFAELVRILSPQGILQFAVPAPRDHEVTIDWGYPDWEQHGHYRVYGRDLWNRFTTAGPFAVLEVEVADPVTGTEDVVYFIARQQTDLAPYAQRLAEHARVHCYTVGTEPGQPVVPENDCKGGGNE